MQVWPPGEMVRLLGGMGRSVGRGPVPRPLGGQVLITWTGEPKKVATYSCTCPCLALSGMVPGGHLPSPPHTSQV